jgi:hypothetical protein
MIAIHKDSLVLRKDVVSRLTIAFSKKPRGQVYVNQSSMFMNPILTNVTSGIERLLQHENIMTTIGDILSLILEMAPNILTDNPYTPPEHDISKFMDFEIDPQSYRNKWIVYLVTEIFNSHNDGDNFFNHLVLLILLFRYLTVLPTDAIKDMRIILTPTKRTSPSCINDAKALILKNYAYDQIMDQIKPLIDNIGTAALNTSNKNHEVNAAVAAVAAVAAARSDAVKHRKKKRDAAAAAANPLAATDNNFRLFLLLVVLLLVLLL